MNLTFRPPVQALVLGVMALITALMTACGGGQINSTVNSVVVIPQAVTVHVGTSTALNLMVTSAGSVSAAVVWSVSPASGLTLTPGDGSPSLNGVTVTGRKAGSYTVTATSSADPLKSGTASLTVTALAAAGNTSSGPPGDSATDQ